MLSFMVYGFKADKDKGFVCAEMKLIPFAA